MACSLSLEPLARFVLVGQEHGRTIPLADVSGSKPLPRNLIPKPYIAGRKTLL
jgi:hypothetical protein